MTGSAEIQGILNKICEDNDYVLDFQTTQEVRDLAAEIMRLAALTSIYEREWHSTDLEPLLGVLTAFIIDLDTSISREKAIVQENTNKIQNRSQGSGAEDSTELGSEDFAKYNNGNISYLEDIKSGAVRSRDRVAEYQLMMITKKSFCFLFCFLFFVFCFLFFGW